MFKEASWRDFGWWVSVSLLVYYAYVAMRYFPECIRRFAFFKTAHPAETAATTVPDSVKQIAVSLRRTIREAGKGSVSREELLAGLRSILKGAESEGYRQYMDQLKEIIINEAAAYCSIAIDTEDLTG